MRVHPQSTFIIAALLLLPWAVAQNGAVVVLEESDFDKVPESVRGQSLAAGTQPGGLSVPAGGTGEILVFDPKRDAAADIQRAVAVAARDGKHVLVEVGGNWCGFCKTLDEFFTEKPAVTRLRQNKFVYVKVNFSDENKNQSVLDKYPLIRGFPHFFVLNGKGVLVRSQRVAHLGTNTGYSEERFLQFLNAFAPRS